MIKIEKTTFFLKCAKNLAKKFNNIADDIKTFEKELSEKGNFGKALGGGLYKARMNNSNKSKGKSGGYGVISYFYTNEKLYLLLIYDKSEMENISIEDIHKILKNEGLS